MNHNRAKEIFLEALDLPVDARRAYLDKACGKDVELRREVERLLSAHAAHSVLDVDATTAATPITEGPGTKIGPYKLLQQIGEGGFGVVFMADQESPVRRRVALKIIKLGMDTHRVVARFEAERQALAMMDHPNIARVLDAGATDSGRPYFVMELVKGEAVTQYADRNNLSIPDRLNLFTQICNAIQHAHTKGIIHRDIKPSNVIVSTSDGRPHAKVIDFGIAKATDHRLTEKTLFTEHHLLVGTPAYMSPEQAEGSLDIDTRTDIYSLGALLYELLTGSTPFDSAKLRSAAYAEMQRIIREVEPEKPSTRLSQSGDLLTALAAKRRVEAKRFGGIVRGELDWIVMKALDKDRARRYESATAFAEDVRRHLSGEPVIAAPPSMAYRAKKFARAHRWGVALVSTGAIACISTAILIYQVNSARLTRELDLKNVALQIETTTKERTQSVVDQAMLAIRLGQPKEVEALLEKSAKLAPNDFRVLCNSANLIVNQCKDNRDFSRADEAYKLLDEASHVDPRRPEPFNMRGILLREQGRLDESFATLQQGIGIDKSYYPLRVTLASTLIKLKKWSEAQQALVDASSMKLPDGDDRPWMRWHNLAAVDFALGNPRAVDDIEHALKEKGGRANPNVRLLEARIRLGSRDSASVPGAINAALIADDLSQGADWAKSGGPLPGTCKRILALAYLRSEEWEKAAAAADEAITLGDPQPAFARCVAAIAYARLGKKTEAAARLKAVRESWPADLEKQPQELMATLSSGLVWLESFSELKDLQTQADASLK